MAASENLLTDLVIPKRRVQITGKTLGRGSYGKVSLVEYDGTLCACKQVRSGLLQRADEADRKRFINDFLRECHIWSTLRHPNIVQFLGVFYPTSDQSGLPNMIIERMKMTLTLLVKKYSDIPLLVNLSLLHDVSLGLRYLHAHDPAIVHRDLSPNNILVTSHLEAKITDLGLAKGVLMESMKTLTKAPGTKDFMPPEAFDEEPVYGPPLDVFSFGGVSCHLLTREWPVPKATKQIDPVTKKRCMLTEVERRQKYIDKLAGDTELQTLITNCLEDDADSRPTAKHISEVIKSKMEIYEKKSTRDGIGPVLWLAEIKCEQEAAKALQQPLSDELPDLFSEPVKIKWKEGASSPVECTGRIAVLFNNAVYVGSGVGSKRGCLFRVDVYHPSTNRWGAAIETQHALFAMAVFKGQLLIAGGMTASNEATDEMFVLVGNHWKHFNNLPSPRWGATAACYQSLIIIVGGKEKENQLSISTDLYDATSNQWFKCDNIPTPLSFLQSVVLGDKIYLLNGLNDKDNASTAVFTASVNNHTLKWKQLESTPLPDSVGVGLNEKYLLAVGGSETNSTVCVFNNKSAFTPSASLWESVGILPVMKTAPAVVSMGNTLIVIGGSTTVGKYTNTVHIGTFLNDL